MKFNWHKNAGTLAENLGNMQIILNIISLKQNSSTGMKNVLRGWCTYTFAIFISIWEKKSFDFVCFSSFLEKQIT